MRIEEALVKAQACESDPPTNETATRRLIITRLIHAMGYEPEDYEEESRDDAGKRPDYILLPGDKNEWYLEAKAWAIDLAPAHGAQAVSYPNHRGKRWAVLSNGRVWRLYDNARQTDLAGKCVYECALKDTKGMCCLLNALSRESILAGGLEQFVDNEEMQRSHENRRRHLKQVLVRQIATPDSPLVLAMVHCLRQEMGLELVTPEEIVSCFRSGSKEVLSEKAPLPSLNSSRPERVLSGQSFVQIVKFPIDGKSERPYSVTYPDGKSSSISSWAELAEKSVLWIWKKQGHLPIPFRSVQQFRYFLNKTPKRRDGKPMRKTRQIICNGNIIWMDPDWTAADFIKMLVDLSDECGTDTSQFRVHLNRH